MHSVRSTNIKDFSEIKTILRFHCTAVRRGKECLHPVGGNVSAALWAPQKTRRSCYTTAGQMSTGMEVSMQCRRLCTHVYCSRIHDSQALESARCSLMDDEWVKKL
jgi:hypothetical protein